MRWFPNEEDDQQPVKHISDMTAYMRWSTEWEQKEDVVTKDFLQRNRLWVMNQDKFTPMAFFDDKRQVQIRQRRNINAALAMNNSAWDIAEETILMNQDDVAVSRGWKGNYTYALNTQRSEHKLEEHSVKDKVKGYSGLLGKKKPEEEGGEQQ